MNRTHSFKEYVEPWTFTGWLKNLFTAPLPWKHCTGTDAKFGSRCVFEPGHDGDCHSFPAPLTPAQIKKELEQIYNLEAVKEIAFAPSEEIKAQQQLALKFLTEVIGHSEAFRNNATLLSDFCDEDLLADYHALVVIRVKQVFSVDITPVVNECLPVILKYIHEKQVSL